jgi:hypothetical protein
MNDDPDLELEAVSAAVDDLATAEERALVESSPALQADVTTFAGIRARVADVSVPPAARESALAAALAAFDQLSSDEPADREHTGSRGGGGALAARRRRQYRVLAERRPQSPCSPSVPPSSARATVTTKRQRCPRPA